MTDDAWEEQEERAAMREAAIRVLQGNTTREGAIAKTKFVRPMRDAADNENAYVPMPGGDRSYHDSTLNYPDRTGMDPAQLEVVYRALCEQEGIDP